MQQLWVWAFTTCVLAVLVLALVPSPPKAMTTGWDKSNHLLAFGVMSWLGCKAFPQRVSSVLLGLMAYGVLIEIAQSYTPNRAAEWLDLVADGVGVFLGLVVWGVAGRNAWWASIHALRSKAATSAARRATKRSNRRPPP